ncbi:MAG: hypothetical protein ACLPWO_06955 [Thermoplasmata archaeon]
MATPRAVRIPRPRSPSPSVRVPAEATEGVVPAEATPERRLNGAGSQRALRLAALYVVVLAALYVGFLLYDRNAPGGTSPATGNGVLLFTGMFVAFALVGALYTVHPAPRAVEVYADHATLVGRWGRRHRLPRLGLLSVSVVRRYPAGWLASGPVELLELWGEDVPNRSYLVAPELFAGAIPSPRER